MESKKIIIIKIGSSVIFTRRNKLDEFRISHIADQIITLRKRGYRIILVVSGAVVCGYSHLCYHVLEHDNTGKQALAGVGQIYLISKLQQIFLQKQIEIAQVLLDKNYYFIKQQDKLKSVLIYYLEAGIIPVINENDVISLNNFGGNDLLAADVTKLMDADYLLILSTMEGSDFGVGGGVTKLRACRELKSHNIKTAIINGKEKDAIIRSIL